MATRKQFPLRIPPELYDAIAAWADDEFRSVNAQIEAILTDAARRAGRAPKRRTTGPDTATPDPDAADAADDDDNDHEETT